jgi:UDPglucose 6-dehydrogenase
MDACRRQRSGLKIQYCETAVQVADGADAVVLVTEWDEFAALNLADLASRMARPILIDGRNVVDAAEAIRVGFDYSGIGCGSRLRERKGPSLLRATA